MLAQEEAPTYKAIVKQSLTTVFAGVAVLVTRWGDAGQGTLAMCFGLVYMAAKGSLQHSLQNYPPSSKSMIKWMSHWVS